MKAKLSKEEYDEYINYGTLGKFKSDTYWYNIEGYAALRPKQYSYIAENDEINIRLKKEGKLMKTKGLTKNATERHLTHQKYVDQVLGDEKVVSCKMNNIQS